MSNVEFEDSNYSADRFAAAGGLPTLVKLLLKTGLVKDENQANYVLIGIAACAVLLTIFIVKNSFGNNPEPSRFVPPPGTFTTQRQSF